MARLARVAGFGVAVLLLSGCSKSRDAVIFNPCQVAVMVSHGSAGSNTWFDSTEIPPSDAVWLPRYITESGDDLKFDFEGEKASVIHVTVPADGPVPIIIPESDCPDS